MTNIQNASNAQIIKPLENSGTQNPKVQSLNAQVQTLSAKANTQTSNNNVVDNKYTKDGDTITIPLLNKEVKKTSAIIAGATTLLAAGIGIFAFVKGKGSTKPANTPWKDYLSNLKDNYTGKIKGNLNNGDKITLEYKDGKIVKSSRKGKENFTKTYETRNGESIVKKIEDGKTTDINLTETREAVNKSQSDVKNLLDKKDSISLDDFKQQAADIKYKSKVQKEELNDVIAKKQAAYDYDRQNKDIKDIKFAKIYGEDGRISCTAATFNSMPYMGKIHYTLPNGDKIEIETDVIGWIRKSTKTDKNDKNIFVKEYYNGHVKKITEDGKTREVQLYRIKNNVTNSRDELHKLLNNADKYTLEEFEKQAGGIKYKSMAEKDKINKIINAKKEAAKKAADAKQKECYDITMENIQKSKELSKRVDDIMKDDAKMQEFLNTKITINKSNYDCTRVETTLDEALNNTILGTYDSVPETIYHGTNKYSYDDILKNGFSTDACNITESGRGVYFGVDKAGAENYASDGAVIKAKYTGGKIANVTPGVVGEIGFQNNVRSLAQDLFGLKFLDDDSDKIIKELIDRCYAQKLKSLGYDAVHAASFGAKCEYIAVLDPKDIWIIK